MTHQPEYSAGGSGLAAFLLAAQPGAKIRGVTAKFALMGEFTARGASPGFI
jgi:hypothetical protein